ncbi:MAG: YihY/virulence factor BrkB family protein [Clostridia bacterium]|nr:YihY/virulence factor BrkB family protein [Clostridia bacterium]
MKKIKTIWDTITYFIGRCIKDDVPVFAAQASFFMVFSVIPLFMLLLTLIKYFIPVDISNMSAIIYMYIPNEIASFISSIAMELFDKSTIGSGSTYLSAITTLWLASKGITSLYQGLNRIYLPYKKMGYIKTRVTALFYTIVFILVIVTTLAAFGFGEKIEKLVVSTMPWTASVIELFMQTKILIFMVILTLIFASFYKFMPRTELSFLEQLPGAVASAVGWIGFSWVYSIYIKYFSRYSYVYGSLTAVVLMMLWIYICMNIFLGCAELNKTLSVRKRMKKTQK